MVFGSNMKKVALIFVWKKKIWIMSHKNILVLCVRFFAWGGATAAQSKSVNKWAEEAGLRLSACVTLWRVCCKVIWGSEGLFKFSKEENKVAEVWRSEKANGTARGLNFSLYPDVDWTSCEGTCDKFVHMFKLEDIIFLCGLLTRAPSGFVDTVNLLIQTRWASLVDHGRREKCGSSSVSCC